MTRLSLPLVGLAVLCLQAPLAAHAERVSVSRCNLSVAGSAFQPGLHVRANGDARYVLAGKKNVPSDLSRASVVAWAMETYGVSANEVSYNQFCSDGEGVVTAGAEKTAAPAKPAVAAVAPTVTAPAPAAAAPSAPAPVVVAATTPTAPAEPAVNATPAPVETKPSTPINEPTNQTATNPSPTNTTTTPAQPTPPAPTSGPTGTSTPVDATATASSAPSQSTPPASQTQTNGGGTVDYNSVATPSTGRT